MNHCQNPPAIDQGQAVTAFARTASEFSIGGIDEQQLDSPAPFPEHCRTNKADTS
jgi:hypothetical protein